MTQQLSLSERIIIERSLHDDCTFATIARRLHRSPSTISREIKRNRCFVNDDRPVDCVNYFKCSRNKQCGEYSSFECYGLRCKLCKDVDCTEICTAHVSFFNCPELSKPPYVCTCCPKEKSCKRNHAYYAAHRAQRFYKDNLSYSHSGIRMSHDELVALGNLIEPLILKGQSLNHIVATHADEIKVSERTLYSYIDSSVFKVRNIDLPKKVAYRRRRQRKVLTRFEYRYRKGRTIEDFKSYIENNPDVSVVEMDTVMGSRTKDKIILTMIFRKTSFMLMFLMPNHKQESVIRVFDYLTELLGLDLFRKTFQVILTDNGVEFKDVEALEFTKSGCRRTRLFYCDPQAAWQKPHVENSHKLLRRILPKGHKFSELTKSKVNQICCHINSVKREQYDNLSPFELMTSEDEKKLLALLNLHQIPADEVLLKPALIKD